MQLTNQIKLKSTMYLKGFEIWIRGFVILFLRLLTNKGTYRETASLKNCDTISLPIEIINLDYQNQPRLNQTDPNKINHNQTTLKQSKFNQTQLKLEKILPNHTKATQT